jgi:hypothetical protein
LPATVRIVCRMTSESRQRSETWRSVGSAGGR